MVQEIKIMKKCHFLWSRNFGDGNRGKSGHYHDFGYGNEVSDNWFPLGKVHLVSAQGQTVY